MQSSNRFSDTPAGQRLQSIANLDGNRSDLATVIDRNIESINAQRKDAEAARSIQDRIADGITWFAGSMAFVYFHIFAFAAWLVVNTNLVGIPPFDPYPFSMLTTIVSLEAIFLSAFVLVSQNRQAAIAERRSELDLHINLLAEYEITRILILTHKIAQTIGVELPSDAELGELEEDVKPATLLKELENRSSGRCEDRQEQISSDE